MRKWQKVLLVLAGIFTVVSTSVSATTVAVFPFELSDTSEGGKEAEHLEWLKIVTKIIQQGFVQYGFQTPDLTQTQKAIENNLPLYGCNGCFLPIAVQHQWEWVAVGRVNKISELILGMRLMVFEAKTEKVLLYRNVSFRGDNLKSWERSAKWLVKNQLKKLKPLSSIDNN